jgi:hypothetical protein
MSSLREAFERGAPGLVEEARQQIVNEERQRVADERAAQEVARQERLANLSPQQRWWQNFRLSVTPFEIPIFIKIEAETWREAIDYLRAHNLNRVTTRCRTAEEAIEQVREKILAWQAETTLVAGEKPPAGALLYWRIYV